VLKGPKRHSPAPNGTMCRTARPGKKKGKTRAPGAAGPPRLPGPMPIDWRKGRNIPRPGISGGERAGKKRGSCPAGFPGPTPVRVGQGKDLCGCSRPERPARQTTTVLITIGNGRVSDGRAADLPLSSPGTIGLAGLKKTAGPGCCSPPLRAGAEGFVAVDRTPPCRGKARARRLTAAAPWVRHRFLPRFF